MLSVPDEVLLQVLEHVNARDLWKSARCCNRQMRRCVEELFTKKVIKSTNIVLSYNLGSGTRRRWYDVSARLDFAFQRFHDVNKDLAIFQVLRAKPEPYHGRTLQKWLDMGADEVNAVDHSAESCWQHSSSWRLQMRIEWRCRDSHTMAVHWRDIYAGLL